MVDLQKGLTSEEVEELVKAGKTNKRKQVKGKSHLRIIFESFFTFFNIVLYLVGVVFLTFINFYPNGASYIPITKFGFMVVIFFNALASIISQEASKHTLEKMRLITDPYVTVIRDGKEEKLNSDKIVEGDILILKSGNQVPCDLKLLKGELSVNESNLTGESDLIVKRIGDTLLSGSFVSSGEATLIAEKVGAETYVAKLEGKISQIHKKKSELLINIHKIIKILIICLIPVVGKFSRYDTYWNDFTLFNYSININC